MKSSNVGQVNTGADWNNVHQIVGELMRPVDTYPPRVEVTEFPSEEQLAAILLAKLLSDGMDVAPQ